MLKLLKTKKHLTMKISVLFALLPMLLLPALIFIGWVWLLHFPWLWVLQATIAIEIILILLVIFSEKQASDVNGASGWMAFGFIIGHAYFAIGISIFRILVWLMQRFGWVEFIL